MQRRIATKLVILLITASIVPLFFFGFVAIWQVRRATILSVTEGNVNVGRRAAEEIHQYVRNAVSILESAAENISNADLAAWQKERILKNHVNRFDEFNRLEILDANGALQATSDLIPATSEGDAARKALSELEKGVFQGALAGKTSLSSVFIKDDLTPAMNAAIPIRTLGNVSGVLMAELDLLRMWRLVDSIRLGQTGLLDVLDADGRMIATCDGSRKKDVFLQKTFESSDQLPAILGASGHVFKDSRGTEVLAVGTRLPAPLGWSVLVAQTTAEAYALAVRIGIVMAIGTVVIALLATGLGVREGSRSVVKPIRALTAATQELARGNWDHRVHVDAQNEFGALAEAFNKMAIQLGELQKKLVLQERHAMFGRIASGLAHDLKHPIQAIENVSRLMDSMHEDPEFRKTFRRTVEREFAKVNLFLENLHNLTHEIPLQPIPLCLTVLLKESAATFELIASKSKISIALDIPPEGAVRIEGDRNSLNRVFSNLISNALQAMPSGGKLTISVPKAFPKDSKVVDIRFQDTGMGIPKERMGSLFEDFVTTKRRGLGLGLPIVRKIIQQHSGTIDVESQVGVGTVFIVRLPLA